MVERGVISCRNPLLRIKASDEEEGGAESHSSVLDDVCPLLSPFACEVRHSLQKFSDIKKIFNFQKNCTLEAASSTCYQ